MGVAKESDKQKKKEEHRERDDKLHDALEDSFPASDPPPMRQPRPGWPAEAEIGGRPVEGRFVNSASLAPKS